MTQYGPMVAHEVTACFGQTSCTQPMRDRQGVRRRRTRKMNRSER